MSELEPTPSKEPGGAPEEARSWKRRFLFAALFTAPIVLEMARRFVPGARDWPAGAVHWVLFVLATPVYFGAGLPFGPARPAAKDPDKAVKGDIAGVTQSLGVAFNSTFIALLISIFLMFLVHQLQLMQERLVFDSENYCDDKVIRHLKAD